MSFVNIFAHNYSVFHKGLIFLMRLAWKSRIRLPYLIMIGFMVLDIRVTLEIIVDVENQMPASNDLNELESSSDSDDTED